jgi:hypothetical protein
MSLIGTNADFSQNNPVWSNQLLGYSTWEKMGPFGCLVTAFANVAQAQGGDFDPTSMNNALKANGLYVRDYYGQVADVAGYYALSAIYPHSHFVEQKNWPANEVAPFSYFDVRSSTNTEIIIMLDYHPETAGIQSHYCRVIGLNDAKNDIEIVDSYTGKRIWLSALSSRVGKKANQIIWTAGKYQKV